MRPTSFLIFTLILWSLLCLSSSCKKDYETLSLEDTLRTDTSVCIQCKRTGWISVEDSLACELRCGITHFNPGYNGYVSIPAFNVGGTTTTSSIRLIPKSDGRSFSMAIWATTANPSLNQENQFQFEIDSIQGLGFYILDTLGWRKGEVSASQKMGMGSVQSWMQIGAYLADSSGVCITKGRMQTNHVIHITQWGQVGSVIKGTISGRLFAFPLACQNWYSADYECRFALRR